MLACLYCGKPYERQSNLSRHLDKDHDTVTVPVTINFDNSVPPLGHITIKRAMADAFMAGKVAFTPAIVNQGDNFALQAIGMSLVIEYPPDTLLDTTSGLQFEPAIIKPGGLT